MILPNPLKNFALIFSIVTIFYSSVHANPDEWKNTNATLETFQDDKKDLHPEGTLLGVILKQEGKTLDELTEKDGKTVVSFKITYDVSPESIQEKKFVVQYGFYRSLDPRLQRTLDSKNIQQGAVIIPVRYLKQDPVIVEFLESGQSIPAPALLAEHSKK